MNKCVLYVGGLSDLISDSQLRDLFGAYGVVARAYVVRRKRSGNSAGYGFVEMASSEQASNAATALEGALLAGNSLRLYVTPFQSQSPLSRL